MFARLRKYLALDRHRRQLLLHAWMVLGRARISLARSSLKQLTDPLTRLDATGEAPGLESPDLTLARDIGWAVRTAASFTPWNSSCLAQVIAAQRMLQRSGIPGVFYIGAAREPRDSISHGLGAHAWLMCGSEFITGESGHERYAVLSAFGWPGAKT